VDWSYLIGPIVFLVVFAAIRGAFPEAPNGKQAASPSTLPPEFKSTWKDDR
jgi:hypothetical protein